MKGRLMRRRLIMLAAGAVGAAGLLAVPSASSAGGDNCPNPAGNRPPGQCERADNGNNGNKPPGHNCPNPAGHRPPGQCKKAS